MFIFQNAMRNNRKTLNVTEADDPQDLRLFFAILQRICFTHFCACIYWGQKCQGIPEQRGGQSKHPQQSWCPLLCSFSQDDSHPLQHSWDQLHCPSLPLPASVVFREHKCKHTHSRPRGVVTAGYLLSPIATVTSAASGLAPLVWTEFRGQRDKKGFNTLCLWLLSIYRPQK